MSDKRERTRGPSGEGDLALRKAVRGLPLPRPEALYRERVRAAFIRPEIDVASPAHSPRRRLAATAGLVLAAVVMIAVVLWATYRVPTWRLTPVGTEAAPAVNGEPVPAGGGTVELARGSRVFNPGPGEARVEVEEVFAAFLAPGTEVILDGGRGFGHGGALHAEVLRGQMMGTTGDRFPGRGMRLLTEETEILVAGTTFGVIKEGDSTCVCVLEGTVEVRRRDGGSFAPASPGERLTFRRDEPPAAGPLLPAEERRLGAIRSRGAPDLP